MSQLPNCPKCNCEYTYENGDLLVCPDCAYEWPPGTSPADMAEAGIVVRDSNGNLLADGDSLQIDVAKDFRLEAGKWVAVMVERRGDEVLVQFQDGPTFYGKHPSYKSELHTVMLGGLEAGHMEVDDVTVWSIKPGEQPSWAATLKARPAAKEVRIKEAKK